MSLLLLEAYTSRRRRFQIRVALAIVCLGISIGTYLTWAQHTKPWITGVNHLKSIEIYSRKLYHGLSYNQTKTYSTTADINTTSLPTTVQSLDEAMAVEQSKRQITLNSICKRSELPPYQNQWMQSKKNHYIHDISNIIVDDHFKILFNFVPKVSCTTWKIVFWRMRRNYSNGNITTLGDGNLPYEAIQRKLTTYRKVLFVREPITRLLSAYLSKLSAGHADMNTRRIWENTYGATIVRKYRPGKNDSPLKTNSPIAEGSLNISLDEFIRFITDMGNDSAMVHQFEDHWLPIYRIANPCVIQYDFIGHYEHLAVEGPYVLKWLGVDDAVKFPKIHASRASQLLIEEYQKVPLDLLRRLWEFYKLDYELFGYCINDTASTLMKGLFD